MAQQQYLTAKEAAQVLGISVATVYAYVSRGLIRSEATGEKSRVRRYRREDVEALRSRKEVRRNPAKAVESALHFGAPVLESAITLIQNGRLYYRGHDALALAVSRSFEEVAALIWRDHFATEGLFPVDVVMPTWVAPMTDLPPIESFQALLPLAAVQDLGAYDLSATAVPHTGARIVSLLTAAVTKQMPVTGIAAALQQAWVSPRLTGLSPEKARALLDTALILCADHELNVSSFTARCVASAASTPYGVVLAGLAALQGAKHGGYTARVEALFREAGSVAGAQTAVLGRLRRGEAIPGFGHKLYPEGDPRACLLLQQVQASCPDVEAVALASALETAVQQSIGLQPTVDFGLVTLAYAMQLPAHAALTLFALGRTVGWIGHALEQYQVDQIIRPRARYTGVVVNQEP